MSRRSGIVLLLAVCALLAGAGGRGQNMGGAYGGAGVLVQERMKRDRPLDYRLLQKVRESEVVVVRGRYDHVETVLQAVGVPYTAIDPEDLDRAELNAGQLLLINCPGELSDRAVEKVRKFVRAGGFLFTTDWSLQNVLEKAFPGYVEFTRRPTRDDVVAVRVLKEDHHFLQHVQSPGDRPRWWLENRSYPIHVLNTRRVEVLMESDEMARKYGEAPIAVTFRYGDGQVLHIVSHYYLQRTETRTARERAKGSAFSADLGLKLEGRAAEALDRVPAGAVKDAYSTSQLSANIVVAKQKQNVELRRLYAWRAREACALRAAPSAGSGRVADLARGMPLKLLERRGEWSQVQSFAGDEGWLESAKLEKR